MPLWKILRYEQEERYEAVNRPFFTSEEKNELRMENNIIESDTMSNERAMSFTLREILKCKTRMTHPYDYYIYNPYSKRIVSRYISIKCTRPFDE